MQKIIGLAMVLFFLPAVGSFVKAETISGKGCYQYNNLETLNGATFIAISLAKRNALEGYTIYTDAIANMQDPTLKNEIITNLTVRAFKGVKVTGEEEDREKREVCRAIQAEVEPEKVKSIVSAVYYAFYNRKGRIRTGLPENGKVRIIKAEEVSCPYDYQNKCLGLIVECRRNTFGERQIVRIIWHDANGLPSFSIKKRITCEKVRDINNFWVRLPPGGETFTLDLP